MGEYTKFENFVLLNLFKRRLIIRDRKTNTTICKNLQLQELWKQDFLNGGCYEFSKETYGFSTSTATLNIRVGKRQASVY